MNAPSQPPVPKKTKVLLELRPALEGFAGIPQETRLLFRGLRTLGSVEVNGLLQTSHRILSQGTRPPKGWFAKPLSEARKINRYSRIIISTADKPYKLVFEKAFDWVHKGMLSLILALWGMSRFRSIKLTDFESKHFGDFVWRTLFSKTLGAVDYDLVASADMKVLQQPWHTMHLAGLNTLGMLAAAVYPHIDSKGIDVFIAQTPFPGRMSRHTKMVVRYHDALPVFMPHTIPNKSVHQASHFYALQNNVHCGAYFACVSEATRSQLVSLFPQAAPRAVTIHNMVSPIYFPEDSSPERVPQIIRSRLYGFETDSKAKNLRVAPEFLNLREQEQFYRRCLGVRPFRYLLVVSTIEPRKNHSRLLAAWEVLKAEVDPDLKLVIVGTLGWDYAPFLKVLATWIDRGEAFMLNEVPSPDLRVLYRHAQATVCPSLGEGFDFSGVEAMRSGGVAISSDIPVHREIYEDASEYFNPYSTMSLVDSVKKVLYAPDADQVREALRLRGAEVAARYLPEKILPNWDRFLELVATGKEVTPAEIIDEPALVSRVS
jgi:glycosyltransferase involved in cell wall biosynthesis